MLIAIVLETNEIEPMAVLGTRLPRRLKLEAECCCWNGFLKEPWDVHATIACGEVRR